MGHVEVAHISHALPDGRVLLDDASFRIGEGVTAALVGPNGAGKTTLLRLISGDLQVQTGTVGRSGGIGVMRQFIGGCQGGRLRKVSRALATSVLDRPCETFSYRPHRRESRRRASCWTRPSSP